MKVFVVYDSDNGHTEVLTRSIADGARDVENTEVFLQHVKDADIKNLAEMDAIIGGALVILVPLVENSSVGSTGFVACGQKVS